MSDNKNRSHSMVISKDRTHLECRACSFVSDNHTEIAKHAVQNQFVVVTATK